ncbi:Protein of unknown function [Halopseudomonas xinjiangensis]|uniref:Thymidine phosphorylase n=1 Tax=Halopseudomonas xinjiangensis TaxID=487184 RepID=A0A1H1UTM3_9GAMM|nr:DUF1631 domain-containing protein [Halopseudomonas xinjiangensis]SDS75805.1 Protein of unknown function [Halopseudomonas xinjiangensis]
MTQDRKVVPIAPGTNRPGTTNARAAALPAPLIPVREHALVFFKSALGELFDNADDSLFEMADKAGSNNEQSMYFEAMRQLRLQRHGLERTCLNSLMTQLDELNRSESAQPAVASTFELDTLSLVQPDDLEQTVALDGMVGRASLRNRSALAHLATRINSLIKARIDERDNPLGPGSLADIFVQSYAPLGLHIKVKLIVLKLFERYVLNRVDNLYEDANGLLIGAGVMPDLKLSGVPGQAPRSGQGGRAASSSAPGSASSAEGEQVLSMFSDLIGSWRHASGDVALSGLGTSGGTPMQTQELLGMLSRLPVSDGSAQSIRNLRQGLHQALDRQRYETGQVRSVARVDDDVISLVSMLFDFILDDPHLPAALKALVSRLQLPLLRVAIADKTFFNRSGHPARRLLNEIARATMGWSDQDDLRKDQLYNLLERIVGTLLDEPTPAPELFERLHDELADFVRVEQRRSERLEQRTRDAEEGRAKVEAARREVGLVLNRLLVGRTLPVFVVDLLRDTWSQVMQITWLREGDESSAWVDVVTTAQRTLDSVEPLGSAGLAERETLNARVIQALRDGLQLVGQDETQSVPLLDRLALLQQSFVTVKPAPATSDSSFEAAGVAEPKAVYVESSLSLEEAPQPAKKRESDVIEAEAADFQQVLVAEPVIQAATVEEAPQSVDDLASVTASAWVADLHPGSWFELVINEGQPAQRCKLAAIISFSGKYIFVNRNGMKVAEFSQSALHHHYDAGLVRLLNDNQLFDRALESVIGNLRKLQSTRS